jgi:hypothetical protein
MAAVSSMDFTDTNLLTGCIGTIGTGLAALIDTNQDYYVYIR